MAADADIEALLQAGAAFARHMLSEHGTFFPFAKVLTDKGEVQAVSAYEGVEHPTAAEVREGLLNVMKAGAASGAYRAVAVFTDVKVQAPGADAKTDAVCAEVEHREGTCMSVFLPYTKSGNDVEFGQMFAGKRDPSVFGRSDSG